MAATQTKLRRGTSAQVNSMTPAEAEVVVDLSNDRLHLGDGTTAGGIILPNAYDMQVNTFGFVTAGGTANAITGTLAPAIGSYGQPLAVKVKITATNTNAVTINLNGLGTRNVTKISGGSIVPLIGGDLVNGGIYELVYDGTQFIVLGAMGGLIQVGQGDLKTSIGSFSASAFTLFVSASSPYSYYGSAVTLPGGQYGFALETGAQLLANGLWGWITGCATTSYVSQAFPVNIGNSSAFSGATVYGRQRYITSSPPYDMGDGEVGGFIFALVNSAGDIVSHYAADAPPWAYNGPTNITATHKCPISGKKFNYIRKKSSLKDVMSGKKIEYIEREITHDVKNADMGLIPHPFGEVPDGHTVVLLDPMSDLTQRMIEYQNSGGDELSESIHKGYIKIDNSNIKRCCPKSVKPCKFKWKGSSNG